MEKYGVNQLRKMFLEYFEEKEHLRMNSFSLVPHNDKSLLLINSGMAPLKPYFTGQEIPPKKRVTTCQKCIRTGDIDNIGKTARHGTFFEMLGNFSFGDYFKTEAIHWAWEFLTEVVGLDANRLYPSIYQDDEDAFEIWTKEMNIPAYRIFRFGKEDNFWEHGEGPCGPCSEIYYDRGEKYGCGKPGCTVGCDCDRYMEIWNIVFSQFDNDGKGNYTDLVQKNIDTGMGLERLASVVQDVDSIFDVDTIFDLRNKVCELAGVEYGKEHLTDVSIRIVTDHIRSATFMISDGIMPSNEGRGYVLRRLIRRAARHGRLLGIDGKFLAKLSETVINGSKDGYPELEEKKNMIFKVLTEEENKFNRTIDQGLNILADFEKNLEANNEKVLAGEDAFKLYDTYGFPLDLTKEILEEKGYLVDEDGFNEAMQKQKELARGRRAHYDYTGAEATVYDNLDASITSKFVGYENTEITSKISAITNSDEVTQAITEGEEGTIIVDETPFYATMGGQVADTGIITSDKGEFKVTDTIGLLGGKIGHVGKVVSGIFTVGDSVNLKIDEDQRNKTACNHSATHLLQQALRDVLGDHVEQAGSLVDKDHLRFDFTHFQAVTKEELEKVEKIVNEKINDEIPVKTEVLTIEEARKTGARALFDEKYGEKVRVVSMGDYSKEFCGGTHVSNTGNIHTFKILTENGVAAGVRRIDALTGSAVIDYYKNVEAELHDAALTAKAEPAKLSEKIEALFKEIKELKSENESLKSKLANNSLGDITNQAKDMNGYKLLATKVAGVDMNGLRNLGDSLKEKLGEALIVLASENDGKVNLVAMATDGAIKNGAHAGDIIKAIAPIVGGGGGGRPNMAQAGGKNPAGIDEALAQVEKQL